MGILADEARPCTIRVVQEVPEIFPEYCPEKGSVYEAVYSKPREKNEFCVLSIKDKKIVLRRGEFEVLEFKERKKYEC